MSGQVTLKGMVVEGETLGGEPASPNAGLYLKIDSGERLELIRDSMAVQMPADVAHRQSRVHFEPHLGQEVTVSAYRSGDTLWGAMIEV